eukprot:TRINITY_DN9197_c0_g1_i1.p1 TRINITY_DN9197_c0_g1~~TRINITY_DN9197_c0_g1_i1.p1  ORF type:complete len:324 (+),score=38.21 TRINITY_DN9197_c0_g1_i1:89-1060(+)
MFRRIFSAKRDGESSLDLIQDSSLPQPRVLNQLLDRSRVSEGGGYLGAMAEIKLVLFVYLSRRDLLALSRTCVWFYGLINNELDDLFAFDPATSPPLHVNKLRKPELILYDDQVKRLHEILEWNPPKNIHENMRRAIKLITEPISYSLEHDISEELSRLFARIGTSKINQSYRMDVIAKRIYFPPIIHHLLFRQHGGHADFVKLVFANRTHRDHRARKMSVLPFPWGHFGSDQFPGIDLIRFGDLQPVTKSSQLDSCFAEFGDSVPSSSKFILALRSEMRSSRVYLWREIQTQGGENQHRFDKFLAIGYDQVLILEFLKATLE